MPLSLNHFTLKTQKIRQLLLHAASSVVNAIVVAFIAVSHICNFVSFCFFFCFVARLLAIVVIIGSVIPICGYPRAAYHFPFTTPPTRWLALVRLSVTCNALFLWQHEHPTHTHTQIYLTASKYTAYRPLTHCLLSSYLFWSFDVAACWHVDTVFRGTCNFFGKFAFICCWDRSIATEIVSQPVYVGVGCENFVEWDLHCLPAGCIHSLFPSVFCFV